MRDATHPAGSESFLSRLHDGELSPAERGAFESHSASCAACREAVAQFELSLAAFRTAPTATVPSDLSARILRKIRAQSPARQPFGVMFGIDIRWAGVFMAALLVAIIAPALLFRREIPATVRSPDAIPAYVVDAERARDMGRLEPPQPAARQDALRSNEEKAPDKAKEEPEANRKLAKTEAQAAAAPAASEFAQKSQAAREPHDAAAAAPSNRAAAATEPSGGEAGAAATDESAAPKVHLEVRPLDGEGHPPAIREASVDSRLAGLRGREFVVVVGAEGRVRDVAPAAPPEAPALREKDTLAGAGPRSAAPYDLLRELRFEPGAHPRRLMVRVE